jgi:transcriptional regulator with PAS, ATPase and Fis domain
LDILLSYSWPGNVRELSHVIERLAVIVPGDVISSSHVLHLSQNECGKRIKYNPDSSRLTPLDDALKNVEKELVVKAHNRLKSSYKVAEALEISQSKAYRLIRKHCSDAVN